MNKHQLLKVKETLSTISSTYLPSILVQLELSKEQQDAKELEVKAIQLASQNQLDKAIDQLTKALALHPTSASILNNRAQVYRLQNCDHQAIADLDRAIELIEADPVPKDTATPRQAYCQRALLRLKSAETKADNDKTKEDGLKDMAKAAELGNPLARSYMARQNPYAALCNQMLKVMFEKVSHE